jgi:hypothetical protein
VRKDGVAEFLNSTEIDMTYEIFNYQVMDWVPVSSFEISNKQLLVYSINCEPMDIFFTENMLVYDKKTEYPI